MMLETTILSARYIYIKRDKLTSRDVGQLGSERGGTRGITQFDLRHVLVLIQFGQLGSDGSHVKLLQRVSLLGSLMGLCNLLLSLDKLGVRLPESRRRRRRRLVESRRDADLLLVNLFHSLKLLVLGNLLQILGRTVKKGDTDVCSFESTDIVRTVTGHERNVTKRSKSGDDEFFLSRRYASVNVCVLDEIGDRRKGIVLLERGTGNADIVILEQGLVKRLRRVDRDNVGLIDVSPDKLYL